MSKTQQIKNRRWFLYPQVGLFLVLIIIFAGGYFVGRLSTADASSLSEKVQYVVGKQDNKPEKVDFSVFWEAWSVVDNNFYGQADKANRLEGAISGMLSSLDDPYTVYLPKDENSIFQANLTGKFSGIGAEISQINGWPTIVAPLVDSPAEKAGLKPKDIIIKVDDLETANENFGAVINHIRGEEGTEVKLTIMREGEQEERVISVTRSVIELPSVKYEVKEDAGLKYGYLLITQFLDDTTDAVKEALTAFNNEGIDNIIIDLRNNPGGVLDGVVDIASLIIDTSKKPDLGGAIVYRQDPKGGQAAFTKTKEPIIKDQKIVVLINAGSASASEILAGALHDYDRAELVGDISFGKGSVQEILNLSNGGSVKVTVAKWLTPAKLAIDHEGVKPDYEVSNEEDGDGGQDNDIQLKAALDLFR